MNFVWFVILAAFVLSSFFESRADEASRKASSALSYGARLTPEICAQYLAGPAPAVKRPRYSTLGLGKNPVPANVPNLQVSPRIGFEVAPRLPNHPFLPRRGVAGWVEIDPQSGQSLINGERQGDQAGLSHEEIIEACLALMSSDTLK